MTDEKRTTVKRSGNISEADLEQIKQAPTDEDIQWLYDEYAIVLGADGHFYRGAKRADIRSAVQSAKDSGENAASKVGETLHTAGEVFLANVVDTPVVALHERMENYRSNRAERLAKKAQRKAERKREKELEEAEKQAAKQAAEAAREQVRSTGHTTAS